MVLVGLRAECDRIGALLIFDEVITGFRLAYGGRRGFRRPRPLGFGKVIGEGVGRRLWDRVNCVATCPSVRSTKRAPLGNLLATAAGAKSWKW